MKPQETHLASEKQTMQLLKKYHIPHVREEPAKDWTGLVKAAGKLKAPWVLKIISFQATHKTDKGLVKLNIHNEAELKAAFHEIRLKAKGLAIECFLLQEQVKGVEYIVGGKEDPVFGNVLVFGLGGVFVELLKERALRVLPVDRKQVLEMMRQTKGAAFFAGYRNQVVSQDAMLALVLKTARLLEKEKRVVELDLNPVIAHGKNILVADARIVLRA